jgi:cytochrome c-type biogenesis protein CcmH
MGRGIVSIDSAISGTGMTLTVTSRMLQSMITLAHLVLALLFLTHVAHAEKPIHTMLMTDKQQRVDAYPFQRVVDADRFQSLIKEIRCVVCQNQTIADSNAPLANDLREKVYHLVRDDKSNEDIKDYLVKRYGEFILLQPRFNKLTLLLWTFPFLGLAIALLMLCWTMKKRANSH